MVTSRVGWGGEGFLGVGDQEVAGRSTGTKYQGVALAR
jgi:hypothetical protein